MEAFQCLRLLQLDIKRLFLISQLQPLVVLNASWAENGGDFLRQVIYTTERPFQLSSWKIYWTFEKEKAI